MRKVATGLRNIFIASLTFVMVCGTASAGDDALPFVRIVRDPVSASMGFAGVASGSETAYSSFRNSSVIPLSGDRFSTGFSYQNWAPDGVKTSNMNFGAAFKAGRFGFAVGGAYQMGEEYTTADASGNPKGTFSPNDMIVNGGVGLRILDNLSAGAQYSFKNMLFARAGYHFGTKEAVLPSFATVGLGVRFFGVSLDFAYLTGNDVIGNSMTFGLGYRF